MSVEKSNIKCQGCGGDLIFSGDKQALYCKNCGRIHTFEVKHNILKFDYNENIIKPQEKSNGKKTNCTNCGAELDIKEREITKICPYCGSNFVLNENEIVGLKPNCVVPFAFDKEKAIEYYKKNVKHKYYLPNKFKKEPNIESVFGTYISCFSFDCSTKSSYDGAIAISTSSSRNGQIENDVSIRRIRGNKDLEFKNYIVESSHLTNQKSFEDIKPFIIDNDTCCEYDENFLRGYQVESYDNDLKNCKKISEELMKVEIKNKILSQYSYSYVQYFNLTTTFQNNKYSYILLPIYFINFNYKNKTYKAYLNGQTGRLGNDLPKSKVKIAFTVLLGLLFLLLILGLSFFAN